MYSTVINAGNVLKLESLRVYISWPNSYRENNNTIQRLLGLLIVKVLKSFKKLVKSILFIMIFTTFKHYDRSSL